MSVSVTRMHTRQWADVSEEEAKVKAPNKKQKSEVAPKSSNKIENKKFVKDTAPGAQKIIFDYNVDPYDHKEEVLMDAVMEMLKHYDLFRLYSFDRTVMKRFLLHVKLFYNPKNLFHNFKHVWGVLHLSFQILTHGGDQYLLPLDIFAIVVAALCHDIQHPGNNNAFELATSSDLSKAKSYNVDAGILERHHATITHSLLNADGTDYDILIGLTPAQKEHFRRQVALIILGTDMAKHTSILAEAQAYNLAQSVARSSSVTPEPESQSLTSSSNNAKSPKPPTHKKFTIIEASCLQIAYEEAKPARRDVVDVNDPESRLAFSRVLVHTADIGAQT